MLKSLEEILAYQNPHVIDRFLEHHEMPREEAEGIFKDVLRFMWLAATFDEKRKTDPDTADMNFTRISLVIDDMWHEFILLTKWYVDFCEEYIGYYLHHPPGLEKMRRNMKTMSQEQAQELFVNELITAVVEYLGEEVAIRWFDAYEKHAEVADNEIINHHLGNG